jgi:hypothetical protein
MTIHEIRTRLSPAEVIERARSFFALAGTPYASFPERAGKGYLKLHMEVGEIVIGAAERDGETVVRGSASRGAHLLTGFLTTLAPPLDARCTTHRPGLHETHAAQVETFAASTPAALEPGSGPATRAA